LFPVYATTELCTSQIILQAIAHDALEQKLHFATSDKNKIKPLTSF